MSDEADFPGKHPFRGLSIDEELSPRVEERINAKHEDEPRELTAYDLGVIFDSIDKDLDEAALMDPFVGHLVALSDYLGLSREQFLMLLARETLRGLRKMKDMQLTAMMVETPRIIVADGGVAPSIAEALRSGHYGR